MLPIPGTSRVKHFEQNMGAVNVRLTEAEWAAIAKAGKSEG
jgi:aryl-alcohol dehydrogenase-like predicted oxidoreductase